MRLAITLLFAAVLSAQSVEVDTGKITRHGDIATNKHGLTLPAGEFTIGEMVDAVAAYLCRNYIYDATIINQRQPLRLQRVVSLDALGSEEVLYALLASRNLAALPLDEARGIFHIVPLDQSHPHPMATIPWRRPQDLVRRPHFREIVMTSLTLEHLDAEHVAKMLRSHFSMLRTWQPGAPTVTFLSKRAIMLHGYGDQLAQVIRELVELDRMAKPVTPAAPSNTALLTRLEALEREVRDLRKQLGK
tara:strand:+ start:15013 stop:15753 length:741 start_codon:yes stop_codon:yes gene_type:complete